ncbi:MAG TPA: multicopper oxidase domain-containing protein [Micromonosporaceae bacterium]|nr:multicopper oxidase domain-containing protein [Micromonosporaceae bacterium]
MTARFRWPAAPQPAPSATPSASGSGRASWHRRVAGIPLAYLSAIVVVGISHPFLANWYWLLLHLLLLGAATNAILIWSTHFTAAVLRAPVPAHRRAEAARLALLNLGVGCVLVGGSVGSQLVERSGAGDQAAGGIWQTGLAWLGVGGAVAVFAAVLAHLAALAIRLRRALPARFTVTVRYYLAAALALLIGIPVGAVLLVVDPAIRPRLVLLHAHVNLLGWISLTVLGTLLTFWPTVLRTRMADGAVRAATRALPLATSGLALLALGLLSGVPAAALPGLVIFAAAVVVIAVPSAAIARQRPPASFAAWSIAAGIGWLLVSLAYDAAVLLTAADPATALDGFSGVLLPLLVGSVAQILIGALAYLLPVALGGGPGPVRERAAALDRHRGQRVVMANTALAVFLLPVGAYVRITTSLLILVALLQFLLPAARILLTRRQVAGPERSATPTGPRRGVAIGLALVLVAVVAGTIGEQLTGTDSGNTPPAANVTASGRTTTITVTAKGMRFHPDRIEVPAGDRLVIEVLNVDDRRHDLVLGNGARTPVIPRGGTARLDAGVIGGPLDGWCSLPGHRQQGMVLAVTVVGGGHGSPAGPTATVPTGAATLDPMAEPEAGFTARDASLAPAPDTRVHRILLRVQEVEREVAPGVRQKLWTFNGTAPGPVLRGRVGDVFEVTLVNDGSLDHGVDFHAGALAPDRPMRPIDPGQSLVYRFTATKAGIWMYHCSTMPMLHHIGNGMYGAVIIDPPELPVVDREYVLVQSEFYLGAPGEPGDLAKMQAERPDAVVFNGYVAQYAHRPLSARVGERVRIWLLNAGPNRGSAFHLVGGQFDTVYREGRWELRPSDPGAAQVLDLAPAAGGFVETVLPEAGTYPFVSHSMVDAERGARGALHVVAG